MKKAAEQKLRVEFHAWLTARELKALEKDAIGYVLAPVVKDPAPPKGWPKEMIDTDREIEVKLMDVI